MLSPQSLHLSDRLALVDDEFLVPHRRERLKLTSVLLLDLHLFSGMLVDKGDFQTRFSLLSNRHDPLELHLRRGEVAFPLIEDPLRVERLQVVLHVVDVRGAVHTAHLHQVVVLLLLLLSQHGG